MLKWKVLNRQLLNSFLDEIEEKYILKSQVAINASVM